MPTLPIPKHAARKNEALPSQQKLVEKKDGLFLTPNALKIKMQLSKWQTSILKRLEELKIATQRELQSVPSFSNRNKEEDPRIDFQKIIEIYVGFQNEMYALLKNVTKNEKACVEQVQHLPSEEREAVQSFCSRVLSHVRTCIMKENLDNDLGKIAYWTESIARESATTWTLEKMHAVEDDVLARDGTIFFRKTASLLDQIELSLREHETNPYTNASIKKQVSFSIGEHMAKLRKSMPRLLPLQSLMLSHQACMERMEALDKIAIQIFTDTVSQEGMAKISSGPVPSALHSLIAQSAPTPSEEKRIKKAEALRAKVQKKEEPIQDQKEHEEEGITAQQKAEAAEAHLQALLHDLSKDAQKSQKKKGKQTKNTRPEVVTENTSEEEAEVSSKAQVLLQQPVVISAEQSARDAFFQHIPVWMQEKRFSIMKLESLKISHATKDHKTKFDCCRAYVNACTAELAHALQKSFQEISPKTIKTVHQEMVQQYEEAKRLLDHLLAEAYTEPGAAHVLDDAMLDEMKRDAEVLDQHIVEITKSIQDKKDELDSQLLLPKGLKKLSKLQEKKQDWKTHLDRYFEKSEQPSAGGVEKVTPAKKGKREKKQTPHQKNETPAVRLSDAQKKKDPIAHTQDVLRDQNATAHLDDAPQNEAATAHLNNASQNETPMASLGDALQHVKPLAVTPQDDLQDEKQTEERPVSQFESAACFLAAPARPFSLPALKNHWLASLLPPDIRNFMLSLAQEKGVFMALSGGAILRIVEGEFEHIVDWDFSSNFSRKDVCDRIKNAHSDLLSPPWKSLHKKFLSTSKFMHDPNMRADISSYTYLSLDHRFLDALKAHAQERSDFTVNALYLIATAEGFCLYDAAHGKMINTREAFDAIPEIKNKKIRITKTNAKGEQDLDSIRNNPILILRALKMIWSKGYTLDPDLEDWIQRHGKAVLEEVMHNAAHPEHTHFQHYIQKELKPLLDQRYHLESMYSQANPAAHAFYMEQECQALWNEVYHWEAMRSPPENVMHPDFLQYIQNKCDSIWRPKYASLVNNKNYTDAQTLLHTLKLPEIETLVTFSAHKQHTAANDSLPVRAHTRSR